MRHFLKIALIRAVSVVTTSGPISGGGLLLEDGFSFVLLENGDFILLE